jgi:glycosyltransferase involved in cell wall biosynthesis
MSSFLFFSDSKVLGGHEVMCLQAIRHLSLSSSNKVHVAFWEGNERFKAALSAIASQRANLFLHPTPVKVKKANLVSSLFAWGDQAYLSRLMLSIGKPTVILCHGRIENGIVCVLVAGRVKAKCIGYLPMAHNLAEMGRPDWFGIREFLLKSAYRRISSYITISRSIKSQILRYAPHAKVAVVENPYVPPDRLAFESSVAREKLCLPSDVLLIGMVGRIEFSQKGQDILARFCAHLIKGSALKNLKFVVVGEGPDTERLKRLIDSYGLSDTLLIRDFHPEMQFMYSAFNAVLMPSRYEGVPLTMLEAVHSGIPVLASRRDGMLDFLPAEWLFDPSDLDDMFSTLTRALSNLDRCRSMALDVARHFSTVDRFGSDFEASLLSLSGK